MRSLDFGHDGPATIQLVHGELQLTEAVEITGAGPELLTIDANRKSRVFNITATEDDFIIQGLTLINGQITGDNKNRDDTTFNGGAIRSITLGKLTVHDSAVRNSRFFAGDVDCATQPDRRQSGHRPGRSPAGFTRCEW